LVLVFAHLLVKLPRPRDSEVTFSFSSQRTIQPQQKYKVSNFQLKYSEENSSKCRTTCKVHFASRLFTYNC